MSAIPASRVVMRAIKDLKPNPHNPRTHSKKQLRKLVRSIRRFGFVGVIYVDVAGNIIAGHGRLQAAIMAGLSEVPTICIEGLSQDEIRAYIIADNQLAIEAGWNHDLLKIEFQNLILHTDIDVELTGFDCGQVDLILGGEQATKDSDDEIAVEIGPPITRPGDIWQLGPHRISCADAREGYSVLMQGRQAQIAFTDPPYNVRINGHATGNGRIHHPEFAMASGEMSAEEFTNFLLVVLRRLSAATTNGSVHYVAMDFRHMQEVLQAGLAVYDCLLNLCVWVKNNGGMGSLYRSQHELVFVFKNGKAQHRNNVQLGRFGRNRTNVWRYPGANTASRSGEEGNLLALHPTVKPVAMIADALLDCSARGEIALDPFLGAGSTLLAAERVGRVCYGLEIEPKYVDTTIRRWQRITGEDAVRVASGRTFNALCEEACA